MNWMRGRLSHEGRVTSHGLWSGFVGAAAEKVVPVPLSVIVQILLGQTHRHLASIAKDSLLIHGCSCNSWFGGIDSLPWRCGSERSQQGLPDCNSCRMYSSNVASRKFSNRLRFSGMIRAMTAGHATGTCLSVKPTCHSSSTRPPRRLPSPTTSSSFPRRRRRRQ